MNTAKLINVQTLVEYSTYMIAKNSKKFTKYSPNIHQIFTKYLPNIRLIFPLEQEAWLGLSPAHSAWLSLGVGWAGGLVLLVTQVRDIHTNFLNFFKFFFFL